VLIPLGTDRYKRRPILVTYLLIAVNLAVYAVPRVLAQSRPGLVEDLVEWGQLAPGASAWWTYLTSAFLHANFTHILFNMLALWVFGPDVEDRLGRIGFSFLYLAGAVGDGAAHALVGRHPVIGASGAVAATIGAFLVFFPYVRVKTLIFFLYIGVFQITAWWYIAFAISADLLGLARGPGDNIAHLAHLGGYGVGVGVSLVLLATRLIPREPYDLFTIGKQAARRRAFKAAYPSGNRPLPGQRKPPDPEGKRLDGPGAKARCRAQELLSTGDPRGAATAYLEMQGHPDSRGLPPLGRRQLYEIANQLFQSGDHANAADAYRQFTDAYGSDAEVPRVLLMLGLLNARFLNDPTEAKRVLLACRERLTQDDDRALAAELLDELG